MLTFIANVHIRFTQDTRIIYIIIYIYLASNIYQIRQ